MGRYAVIILFILTLISSAYAMDPLSLKDLSDTVEARFPIYDSYVAGTGAPYSYVDAHIYNGSGNVHGLTTADVALKSLSLSQFSATNLTQIITRNHSDLQNILGGGGYHLSLTDYGSLVTTSVLLPYATKAYVNGTDEALYLYDSNLATNLYGHIYNNSGTVHGLTTADVALKAPLSDPTFSGIVGFAGGTTYKVDGSGNGTFLAGSFTDDVTLATTKKIKPSSNANYIIFGDLTLGSSMTLYGLGSSASSRGTMYLYAVTSDGSDSANGSIRINGYDGSNVTEWAKWTKTGAFYLETLGSAGTGTDLVIDTNKQIIPKSSSRRYKFNIKSLDIKPSDFMKLQPVSFNYKVNLSKSWSLCAEDVYKIFPDAVTLIKGKAESIKSECITAVLVFMVQYQQRRIDNLEKRIELLEMRR